MEKSEGDRARQGLSAHGPRAAPGAQASPPPSPLPVDAGFLQLGAERCPPKLIKCSCGRRFSSAWTRGTAWLSSGLTGALTRGDACSDTQGTPGGCSFCKPERGLGRQRPWDTLTSGSMRRCDSVVVCSSSSWPPRQHSTAVFAPRGSAAPSLQSPPGSGQARVTQGGVSLLVCTERLPLPLCNTGRLPQAPERQCLPGDQKCGGLSTATSTIPFLS